MEIRNGRNGSSHGTTNPLPVLANQAANEATHEDGSPAGYDPSAFVPEFPWMEGITEETLSTKRGFVFQYPPFPALQPTEDAALTTRQTAGLYVHVPFCPYHCSYCYYAVEINQSEGATDQYLGLVEREAELVSQRPALGKYAYRTMFIGGGTPTYLDEKQLARLIEAVARRFDLGQLEEFSVESDPTTLSVEKVRHLRSFGVNRMSIGIQSFSTEINLLNERKHSGEESLRAHDAVRRAGIDNLNLDLICGLIGETDESWDQTIDQLLTLAPEHVTMYLFSLRPQTSAFLRIKGGKLPAPPEESTRIEMYLRARRRLLERGYVQTTPNCFAREPRFEQVHQRNAWSSLPLIGLGNSAYSFFDDCVTQNFRSVNTYARKLAEGKIPVEIGHRLHARDQMIRYCVLRLKQLRVERADFQQRFGFDLTEVLGAEIARLAGLELVKLTDEALVVTPKGIVYIDDVGRTIYSKSVRARLAGLEQGAPPVTALRQSLI